MSEKTLKKKIQEHKATLAIVGLGYVGLPLACAFASKGFRVLGIDLDEKRISFVNRGKSYIGDIASARISKLVKKGKLRAYSNFQCLSDQVDAVIVCVPTPLNRVRDPDISFIVDAAQQIQKHLHRGQLIILESTTYPGTTEEVILPSLEKSGLKVGKDFFLCFSPERVDPGNHKFKTQDIAKVVGGVTPVCTRLGVALYRQVTKNPVQVSSPRTAEMTKLLENTFRIVNIGLINELAQAAESLNIDIWEAIDAAKTKPFGFMPFYPGPGIGGHCIGVDPVFLSWKARMHGTDLQFIELARKVNAGMPEFVVSKAVYALSRYRSKSIQKAKVLILGVTYKRDVADMRESPALEILESFKKMNAQVSYHDPYIPEIKNNLIRQKSVPLTETALKKQDLVVLTTDHKSVNYALVVKHSKLIYDSRNALKKYKNPNIIRL